MLIPTLIMGAVAGVLLLIGYRSGQALHMAGLNTALKMLIQVFPILVCSFIMAGMVQVLIPQDVMASWVGEQSGFRGILIGSFAGGLTTGGPFVSLPVASGLFQAGASVGTIVAFLTGWSLWGIARMPLEVGILGWKLTLVRLACTFIFPPIAGFIAQLIFGHVRGL